MLSSRLNTEANARNLHTGCVQRSTSEPSGAYRRDLRVKVSRIVTTSPSYSFFQRFSTLQSAMFSARVGDQAYSDSANEMGKAPISRRKRKTLSCYECRRRKLRCDREEPSCSRCRSAGQGDSCSYEQKPIPNRHEHALAASPSASPPISTSARRWTPATSHGAAPSNGSESVNPTVSTARNLGEDITTQTPLVSAQNSGSWQLLYTVSSANELRPAIRPGSNAPSPYKPTTPEAVIFRGENFKTHYYGSSNPISLISHVRKDTRQTIWN